MQQSNADVVVVGGGPAGLIAAIESSRTTHRVILLERNEKLGKKLYITGKGRCNLTNASDREGLLAGTVHNGKFLYSAFSAFGSSDLMAYVEALGVPLAVERGNRVFPASGKASDVTRALEREISRLGVTVALRSRVKELLMESGRVAGVVTEDGTTYRCSSVVLATGGAAYPATGSTGDGYRLAAQAGHRVIEPRPALVPLEVKEEWAAELQGLALKNVRLTLSVNGKRLYTEVGEMLFTHFGVSGPLVLTVSSYIETGHLGRAVLSLDMKPGLDMDKLDARLVRDFQSNPNQALKNALGALVPARMGPLVAALAGINAETPLNTVSKQQRLKLAETLKDIRLTPAAFRPLEEAVITRGGVDCSQVNPTTMESRLLPGLYLCGELLDVDALTGGFNLQVAFSTGFVAGRSAGSACQETDLFS